MNSNLVKPEKLGYPHLVYNFTVPLSANPTKWSNTLKQFLSNSRRIVWVCLTILWGWRFKGLILFMNVHTCTFRQSTYLTTLTATSSLFTWIKTWRNWFKIAGRNLILTSTSPTCINFNNRDVSTSADGLPSDNCQCVKKLLIGWS